MTGPGDYPSDVEEPDLDDAQAEALLQGRSPAGPDVAALAAFLGDLRRNAARPAPPPSPALAALLREGSPVPAPAPPAPGKRPAGWLRGWRRGVAVAGIGTSVLLTSVVGAGAAGLLPGPAERVVEEAVVALTPLELPKQRTEGRARDRERARTGVGGTPTSTGPSGEPSLVAPSTTAPSTTMPDQARPGVTSTTSVPDVTTPPGAASRPTTTTTAPATTTTSVPGLPRLPVPTTLPTVTLPTVPPISPVTIPRFRW